MKNRLRKDIIDRLIGYKEPEGYEEFCTFILMIDRQMSEAKSRETTFRRDNKPKTSQAFTPATPVGDVMDWTPTVAAMTPAEQGKLIAALRRDLPSMDSEEGKHLRRGKKCRKCGEVGYFARDHKRGGLSTSIAAVTSEDQTSSAEQSENDEPLA